MKASKIDRASLFRETWEVIYKNMIKYYYKENPDFHYTKPSPERYPYQFFWDTSSYMFILCALMVKSVFNIREPALENKSQD